MMGASDKGRAKGLRLCACSKSWHITKQPLVVAFLEHDKQPFLQTQNNKISSS